MALQQNKKIPYVYQNQILEINDSGGVKRKINKQIKIHLNSTCRNIKKKYEETYGITPLKNGTLWII